MKRIITFTAIVLSAIAAAGCANVSSPDTFTREAIMESEPVDNGVFDKYIKDIYKNADEYVEGLPVYRDSKGLVNAGNNAIRVYKGYEVLDYDGDGDDELFLYCGLDEPDIYEAEANYDRDIDPKNMTDMYILCEYEDETVSEMPGKVVLETPGDEVIFLSNGCAVVDNSDADKKYGIKYDKVGFFDVTLPVKMGLSRSSDDAEYIYYMYYEPGESIQYDFHEHGHDYSHGIPLTQEQYQQHVNVIEEGNAVDISCREFSAGGIGITQAELSKEISREGELFLGFLKNIYNTADIVNGYPVDISLDDWGGWTTYKKFAVADFDGDGADELLVQEFGPYAGGLDNMDETDFSRGIYPYFTLYEVNESGEVVDSDDEPYKHHGDLWLMWLERDAKINSAGFTFYDNGVFRYEDKDEDGNNSVGYYIFNDDIYRDLEGLNHRLFTNEELYGGFQTDIVLGADSESAICYTVDKNGDIMRKVGSHQDAATDIISPEEYDSEVNVLTAGNKVDTVFKEVRAKNLDIEARGDTLHEYVIKEKKEGLADLTFTGRVKWDESGTDGAGNPDPVAVLALDESFIYCNSEENFVRVDEVQLGNDTEFGDNLGDYVGKRVSVTGTTFSARQPRHHRPVVMLVKAMEVL